MSIVSNSSLTPFEQRLIESWPPSAWTDLGLLVAVSGGADSVALLRSLQRLKSIHSGRGELMAAHFNHRLRPQAADDAIWVQSLCDRFRIRLVTGEGDVATLAAATGDGLESAARTARLAFLETTARQCGARFIATGHTADDQVETVLFRILRGTGLAGLAGIRRARPLQSAVTLIRPLLPITRADVEAYLHLIGQDWRDDATNRNPCHARNRIRHNLLPQVRKEFNSQVDQALIRLAKQAEAAHAMLRQWVAGKILDCVAIRGRTAAERLGIATRIEITIAPLAQEPEIAIAELVRVAWRDAGWSEQAMTESHWHRLVALIRDGSPPTRHMCPGRILAQREGDQVTLSATDSIDSHLDRTRA